MNTIIINIGFLKTAFKQLLTHCVVFGVLLMCFFSSSRFSLVSAQEISPADRVINATRSTLEGLSGQFQSSLNSAVLNPACSLYSLGIGIGLAVEENSEQIGLDALWNDNQWSVLRSVLDVSVLFRSKPWRESIWALTDSISDLRDTLPPLYKIQCQLRVSRDQATGEDRLGLDRAYRQINAEIDTINTMIAVLNNQLYKLFSEDVQVVLPGKLTDKNREVLDSSGVYYWLYKDVVEVDWSRWKQEGKQFLERNFNGLNELNRQIPESCFVLGNILEDIALYSVNALSLGNGNQTFSLNPQTGVVEVENYQSFRQFLQKEIEPLNVSYARWCGTPQGSVAVSQRSLTQQEKTTAQQYQQLRAFYQQQQQWMTAQAVALEAPLAQAVQNEGTSSQAQDLLEDRATLLGLSHYYSLLEKNLGLPSESSLQKLTDSLSQLVESLLGLEFDEKNRQSKSKLSFSERFEAAEERRLQQICSRLQNLYQKAGRDPKDLPLIGSVNGKVYCQAQPSCENVQVSSLAKGLDGLKELAECSGINFNAAQQSFSSHQDILQRTSDDLSVVLQESALNDLLKLKRRYKNQLRSTLTTTLSSQQDQTTALVRILQGVNTGLYNPAAGLCYNEQSPVNSTGLLRYISVYFQDFLSYQDGSCSVEELSCFES